MLLSNMTGQTIGDASVAGANVVIGDTDGLTSLTGTVLQLDNVDASVVDNIDAGRTGGTGTGIGVQATGCDDLTVRNIAVSNRQRGVVANSGSGLRVLDNAFTNTGLSGGYAISVSSVAASAAVPARILVTGNTFAGSAAAWCSLT